MTQSGRRGRTDRSAGKSARTSKTSTHKAGAGNKTAAKPVKKLSKSRKKVDGTASVQNVTTKKTAKESASVGRAAGKGATSPVRVPPGMRIHLLEVPFEEREIASAARARWNPELRSWVHFSPRDAALPAGLVNYRAARHSWEAWREHDLNGGDSTSPRNATGTTGTGIELHPHQTQAADLIERAFGAGRPGVLLADEVGLGKTYSALAGINRIPGPLKVLIVAPLSVVAHWRASIDAIGSSHRFCVINYDRTKKLLDIPDSAQTAKRARTKNKRIATKGTSVVDWDVVIVDESHLLKNPTAQRTAAVRQLQANRNGGAFTIWCSATAGQNPVELSYLNRLIAAVSGKKVGPGLGDFETWCKSLGLQVKKSFGGLVWSPNDTDLSVMNGLLFGGDIPAAIRRRPADIVGWPELERIPWPAELDAQALGAYQDSWEQVLQALRREAEHTLTGPKGGAVRESSNALVALLRFRQKASALRVESTIDMIETMLANGRQVAVSVEFTDTLEAIAGRLRRRGTQVSTIHGAQAPTEREHERLAFQRGENPVIVFTVKEGISLHAGEKASKANDVPRVTLVHDPRWDAISTAQIEGRTWRDGQHSACYHIYAAGTVEEKVVNVMLEKLEAMKTMLADSDLGDVRDLLNLVADI